VTIDVTWLHRKGVSDPTGAGVPVSDGLASTGTGAFASSVGAAVASGARLTPPSGPSDAGDAIAPQALTTSAATKAVETAPNLAMGMENLIRCLRYPSDFFTFFVAPSLFAFLRELAVAAAGRELLGDLGWGRFPALEGPD
jgi:hypothetical protein